MAEFFEYLYGIGFWRNDYYPFGMQMPGRKYSLDNSYRYGFNGKEDDNEVKGEGNQQDYGMRIYDPRLGRFSSVDPLTKKYPFYSVYQFAGNTPIQAIDLDGAEPWGTGDISQAYKAAQQLSHQKQIRGNVINQFNRINTDVKLATSSKHDEMHAFTPVESGWEKFRHSSDGSYSVGEHLITELIYGVANDVHIAAQSINHEGPVQDLSHDLVGSKEKTGSILRSLYIPTLFVSGPENVGVTATKDAAQALDGSFSITEYGWRGYPKGIPKPQGPFRLIEAEEYAVARTAANDANRALSKTLDLRGKAVDIHEITPVKFGGSPTNISNKVFLDRQFHQTQVTPFWNRLLWSIQ